MIVKDRNRKQLKVVFVHDVAKWYRLPFFKALAQLYDLVIFFTNANSVDGLQGVKYEVLKRPLKNWRAISFLQVDRVCSRTDLSTYDEGL